MVVTWTIPQVEYDLSVTQDGVDYTNVINIVHWRASDEDADGNTGNSYGTVSIDTSDLATDWIDYASMTEAEVLTMAQNALGAEQVTAIETSIAAQISALKNPTTGTGVPW